MTRALDQSILELLRASHDDVDTITFPVNDRTFGFHAQQAIEKLLKALIGGHALRYEFTHDLGTLMRDASALGESLPLDPDSIEKLTAYAGVWRYQEPESIRDEDREELKATISALRLYVLHRLSVLRPTEVWPRP